MQLDSQKMDFKNGISENKARFWNPRKVGFQKRKSFSLLFGTAKWFFEILRFRVFWLFAWVNTKSKQSTEQRRLAACRLSGPNRTTCAGRSSVSQASTWRSP